MSEHNGSRFTNIISKVLKQLTHLNWLAALAVSVTRQVHFLNSLLLNNAKHYRTVQHAL